MIEVNGIKFKLAKLETFFGGDVSHLRFEGKKSFEESISFQEIAVIDGDILDSFREIFDGMLQNFNIKKNMSENCVYFTVSFELVNSDVIDDYLGSL